MNSNDSVYPIFVNLQYETENSTKELIKNLNLTKNLLIGQELYFDIIEEYFNRKSLLVYGLNENKTDENVWNVAEFFLRNQLKYISEQKVIDNVERLTISKQLSFKKFS